MGSHIPMTDMRENKKDRPGYAAWLRYQKMAQGHWDTLYRSWCQEVFVPDETLATVTAVSELCRGIDAMSEHPCRICTAVPDHTGFLVLGITGSSPLIAAAIDPACESLMSDDGYIIRAMLHGDQHYIVLAAKSTRGLLYAVFHFLRHLQLKQDISSVNILENPASKIRMVNHWDNMDGSIERGYAGRSIFFQNNAVTFCSERIRDYARLLSSVGINAISINNVNVHQHETRLITADHLKQVAEISAIFREYGIQLFLSINFASPIDIGGLSTADPLETDVRKWWQHKAAEIYEWIPDFGGFLVKADSEFRPGPFAYNRDHADGANMLAQALEEFGGVVIWRCFVYNCLQDWRDRSIDRACSAFNHFKPLDGKFNDNVILQIKNGPMDFQVREPVSTLFGALAQTNQMLELQITQEYTGQQKHLCYLLPQWKEVLDFDTYATGEGATVAKIVVGSVFQRPIGGVAGVANIGDDMNWTGHPLAQANLYGFGRVAWNPALSVQTITEEWVRATFGNDALTVSTIGEMLLQSWSIYESYTAPLGVGWMVNPHHHFGPNVDGYEYAKWGTYHFADWQGIGVDRTVSTGTGYAGQYHAPIADQYESLDHCPDELLLFFHHVSYKHQLKSDKTVIQHIYDSHFAGAERVHWLRDQWVSLQQVINPEIYSGVLFRLNDQLNHAQEWRDVINTYFLRKSGIADEQGRRIY